MVMALSGGMDRFEKQYALEAEKFGIKLKVFTKSKNDMASKIRHVDVLVIFTNKVSHRAKKEVVNLAKMRGIPVFMYHSCGICTLRYCFSCLRNM